MNQGDPMMIVLLLTMLFSGIAIGMAIATLVTLRSCRRRMDETVRERERLRRILGSADLADAVARGMRTEPLAVYQGGV